ncbi:lysine-specific metallo-endopeptidase, partial [Rhizoctonia solani AG-3 Rhs1AP]
MSDRQFIGCSLKQRQHIQGAAIAANVLAANGMFYIIRSPSGQQPLYKTWFGTHDEEDHSTVVSTLSKMHNRATSLTYDCQSCSKQSTPSKELQRILYSLPDTGVIFKHKIALCQGFWEASIVGASSQASRIVEELLLNYGEATSGIFLPKSRAKTTAAGSSGRAVASRIAAGNKSWALVVADHPELVLDLEGGGSKDETPVLFYKNNAANNQKWYFERA